MSTSDEQLWRVMVELNRRRKMRAEMGKANQKEVKMKRVLSAFGPARPSVSRHTSDDRPSFADEPVVENS